MNKSTPLLRVEQLSHVFQLGSSFLSKAKKVYAVNNVSFEVKKGETLGIVGESGCGKSTLGRAVLQLYKPTSGKVHFQGRELTTMSAKELARLRQEMQIIFQDPMESLNGRHTVLEILTEPFAIHNIGAPKERKQWACDLLEKVGLSASAVDRYPHEFSGGQRQRIGIARAIALQPKLIVCDEAVSALDVSVQAQIINLLLDLQEEMGMALIFIGHDLSVVKHISDRIAVMYLGSIVEITSAERLYSAPQHPYTKALISSIPVPDPRRKSERQVLKGDVPSPVDPPSGCHFHPRCPLADDLCRTESPKLKSISGEQDVLHRVSCHKVQGVSK